MQKQLKKFDLFPAWSLPLLFLIFFCSFKSYASKHNPIRDSITFDYLGREHGLYQTTIYDILQDRIGFIWLATQAGVNRYDGKGFKLYGQQTYGIHGANSLAEDRQNKRIWIGHARGLSYISTEDYNNVIHIPDLTNKRISSILVIGNNSLLVTTEGDSLYLIKNSKVEGKPIDIKGKNDDRKNSMVQIGENILVSAGPNLYLCRFQDDQISKIGDPKNYDSNINVLKKLNGTNDILIGLEKRDMIRVKLFDDTIGPPINTFPETFNAVAVTIDSLHRLWIGTANRGINIFPDPFNVKNYIPIKKRKTNIKEGLSSNHILSLCTSLDGVVWVGTYGIDLHSPNKIKFKHLFQNTSYNNIDLTTNFVWTIKLDPKIPDVFWLGTKNGLVRLQSIKGNEKVQVRKRKDVDESGEGQNEVLHLVELNGYWLIATREGLFKTIISEEAVADYESLNDKFPKEYSENLPAINYLLLDTIDTNVIHLWLGTTRGVFRARVYNNEQIDSIEIIPGTASFRVNVLSEDHEGNIWVGTSKGISIHDPETGKLLPITPTKDSLLGNIISFHPDIGDSIMWVGSAGLGIFRFDITQSDRPYRFTSNYTIKEGLVDDVIYGILQDRKNNLWLSTNKGLSHFYPQSEIIINYTEIDGLQSDEFNAGTCVKDPKNDKLFFGGVNGITEIQDFRKEVKSINLKLALLIHPYEEQNEKVVLPENEIFLEDNPYGVPVLILTFDYRQLDKRYYNLSIIGTDAMFNKNRITEIENNIHLILKSKNPWFPKSNSINVLGSDNFGDFHINKVFKVNVTMSDGKWLTLFLLFAPIVFMVFSMFWIRNKAAKVQVKLQEEKLQFAELLKLDRNNLINLGGKLLNTLTPEEVFAAVKKYIDDCNWKIDLFGIDLHNPKFKHPNGRILDVLESKFTFENGQQLPAEIYVLQEKKNHPSVKCFTRCSAKVNQNTVVRSGFYSNDLEEESTIFFADFQDQFIREVPKSAMYVPLTPNGYEKPLGVMKLHSKEKKAFTEDQFELFQTLAKYTAIALREANDNLDKTLLDLQMKRFKDQAYYHFVSQSISGIRSLIRNGQKDIAMEISENLGWLIREIMELPMSITLEKEVQFLKSYIQIQQKGRGKLVRVEWPSDERLLKYGHMKIPSMILQLIIENSIAYGLNLQSRKEFKNIPIIKEVLIKIAFNSNEEFLIITVEDNGIGLKNRKKLQQLDPERKKSRALNLTNERIDLINKIMKSRLVLLNQKKPGGSLPQMTKIIPIDKRDIRQSNNETGTYVKIEIPLIYNFDLL